MLKKLSFLAVGLCLTALATHANAGTTEARPSKEVKNVVVSNFPYEKGALEIQGMAGAYYDPGIFEGQPKLPYALQSLRVGCMVTDPMLGGLFRGNFEVLLEAMGGEFISGPADYLVGGNLILRWNFVQVSNPKWVPYAQIAGGAVYHNAVIDENVQTLLGSNIEAMVMAGIGIRYHLNANWAFDAEVGWRHISNASTSDHNLGLNVFGGQFGLSYFFH